MKIGEDQHCLQIFGIDLEFFATGYTVGTLMQKSKTIPTPVKSNRVLRGHHTGPASGPAIRKRERQLCIEAARDVETSPGNANEFENPEDFFGIVRQMRNR